MKEMRVILSPDGRMRADIESDPRTCEAVDETYRAVLEILGAKPMQVKEESPPGIPNGQPLKQKAGQGS